MALILWDGLPIYRHLFVLERVATFEDIVIMWIAVLAIQFSYWHTLRHPAPFTLSPRPFLGHVVLFLSRLSFVFASSLFALVVYRHPDVFEFRPDRVLLFALILFSVFCATRHIESLGNLLVKGSSG